MRVEEEYQATVTSMPLANSVTSSKRLVSPPDRDARKNRGNDMCKTDYAAALTRFVERALVSTKDRSEVIKSKRDNERTMIKHRGWNKIDYDMAPKNSSTTRASEAP